MKTTKYKFTDVEKHMMKEILESGFKDFNNSALYEIKESIHLKLFNTFQNLNKHEVDVLLKFTVHWLSSNQHLLTLLHDKFYGKNPLQYLLLDDFYQNLITRTDAVHSIKEKLTDEKQFYYSSVFEKITKIRAARKFYISRSGTKPYKIAIIDKREVLHWELYLPGCFEELAFEKISTQKHLKDTYTHCLNREELRNLLDELQPSEKEKNILFLQGILDGA